MIYYIILGYDIPHEGGFWPEIASASLQTTPTMCKWACTAPSLAEKCKQGWASDKHERRLQEAVVTCLSQQPYIRTLHHRLTLSVCTNPFAIEARLSKARIAVSIPSTTCA